MDTQITDKMDPGMTGTGVPDPGSLLTVRRRKALNTIHSGITHRATQAQRPCHIANSEEADKKAHAKQYFPGMTIENVSALGLLRTILNF